MTDAREIIARAIEPFVHHADDVTSVVANTLTTAGYRILGPDTTAMDRIEIAKAIYHATPRNKPFERLSAFKRERILAEADAFLASLSAAGYRVIGPDEVDALQRALAKAEDGAGTLPAKEAVKLCPADWHALCSLVRSLGRKA